MTVITVEHNDIPPSANDALFRTHHQRAQRIKKQWQETFGRLLMLSGLPRGLDKVTVTVELKFTDPYRTRDSDNYYLGISKPLGDALKNGWIPDDSPDHYAFERVRISNQAAKQKTMTLSFEF